MPNFKYTARDNFSKSLSGTIEADTNDQAAKKLRDMGYFPLQISEVSASGDVRALGWNRKVKLSELASFTRQLYAVQKAYLPLLSGLEAIAAQAQDKYFKSVIEDIARSVKGGSSFSDALKKFPNIFDEVYVSMIRAAESSGTLVEILQRLNQIIEKEIDTRQRIAAATRYPMLAFFVLCLGFLIVVTFVIPRFASVYGQFKAALPLPTQILIFISVVLRKFWYLVIMAGAGAYMGFRYFINSAQGRPIWDNFKLNVPVVGQLITMLTLSRFARVTAILIKSGVPILEVLDLVGKATGNVIIGRAILNIKDSVKQGKGLAEPMKVSGVFPPAVVQMVYVGEQTAKLDELLLSIADYYDSESGYMIQNLTTYIEPILIAVLAGMVLTMALAIFMPMWNLIKVFRPS